jgi:hypothetical protein
LRILVRVTFDPMEETEPNMAEDSRSEREMRRRMKTTGEVLRRYGYLGCGVGGGGSHGIIATAEEPWPLGRGRRTQHCPERR